MWIYEQSTGTLRDTNNNIIGHGYSGHGVGRDNPTMQDHKELGPIPRGRYVMEVIADPDGNWVDYEHKKAPVLRLVPDPANEMFGRDGFLMHGDSISQPGTASLGCIVVAHWVRTQIANALLDNELAVTL
jgi:hypothetical protein